MAAVIGALRADLSASVAKFEADMGKAAKAVKSFGASAQKVSANLESAGQRMTLALTAPFLALAVTSAKAAAESSDAIAQVESRLASMGGASMKTSEELQASAKQLQHLSTFDDDDILRNVTNAMLTFGNVSGEQFDRAQRAAVDMATSLQTELQPAAIMIGKALNDPTKGITKLTKAGVTFTAGQIAQIKALQKAGDIYGAQSIMLAELEREFKGAGQAARDAVPGSDAIDAWREFQETIGGVFLRVIDAVEPFVIAVLDGFNKLTPGMQTFIVALAGVAAAIGPVLWAFGAFIGAIGNLAPIWAGFMEMFTGAMAAAGITEFGVAIRALAVFLGPIVGIVALVVASLIEFRGVLVQAFQEVMAVVNGNLLPAFQNLFGKISALFAELSSGPIGAFVRLIMWMVAEVTGALLALVGVVAGRFLAAMVDTMATVIGVVTDLVKVVQALLSGDFAGAWEAAVDLVENAVSGILDAFENIIPGITAAAQAVFDAVKTWIGDRISETLEWISGRFPGLVAAVQAAAAGATAWARNLYNGIKSWISDKLGPMIEWAKARIRELNSLFGWITRRQAQVSGKPAEAAAPAPEARPARALPADDGGGGGGGGGGGRGGGGGGGESAAEKKAKELKKATETFAEALKDTDDAIDKAFDRRALPRSMQQANALREKIEESATAAREAGVDMTAFAAGMALAQQRIRELEIEGLAIEARAFADDVRKLSEDVVDFGGGLPPLEDRLSRVDGEFADLRAEILEQIDANKALAGANSEAAAAMAVLERQLGLLDAAHAKATEGARAQYAAEQNLANLQAAKEAAGTSKDIRDLQQRASGQFQSQGAQELQRIQDELDAKRIDNAIELASLEGQLQQAQVTGDAAEMARLQNQIALQTQLGTVIDSVTAKQLQAADKMQDAFSSFADDLSSELSSMIMDWKFDMDGLRSVFKKLANDLFIKPMTDQASSAVSSTLMSMFGKFAGGFAVGGTLSPGQWGIAGENGPEPIFAGAAKLGVMSNPDAFGGGKGGGNVYFNIQTPNADSFRMSERQMARKAKQVLGS